MAELAGAPLVGAGVAVGAVVEVEEVGAVGVGVGAAESSTASLLAAAMGVELVSQVTCVSTLRD